MFYDLEGDILLSEHYQAYEEIQKLMDESMPKYLEIVEKFPNILDNFHLEFSLWIKNTNIKHLFNPNAKIQKKPKPKKYPDGLGGMK